MNPSSGNSTFEVLLTSKMWQRAKQLVSTLRAWSVRGAFALLDQGLISGSNFVVAILLAQWLTPSEYGTWALAFEVFLFVSIVYSSLVLEPMSVFGPSLYRDDLRGYLGILLRIHCVFAVLITTGVFATATVVNILKPASSLPLALVGVSVATPCLLLFWLARRGFYVLLMPQKAAWGACAYSAAMLAGMVIVYRMRSLSPLTAFLMMMAAAAITAPGMLFWFKRRLPLSPPGRIQAKDVLRKHWRYGCWALGSSAVIWFSAALFYPLLGTFFTLAETGKFKALMNLNSPIGQAFFAVGLLSLPYASRAQHDRNEKDRSHLAWKLTGLYASGTCAYWVVLFILRSPIVHHLYGGKYSQIMMLIPWLAVGSILRLSATGQTTVLKSINKPELVFVAYSAACVVSIALGIPATRWFGVTGAVFAWGLSSGVAFLMGALLVQRNSGRSVTSPAPERVTLAVRKRGAMIIEG